MIQSILKGVAEIYAPDVLNRTAAMVLQQLGHLEAEEAIVKQKTAHIGVLLIFND